MKFKSKTNNISLRTKTDNFVNWSPKSWNSVGESGKAQETPDLKLSFKNIYSIKEDGLGKGWRIRLLGLLDFFGNGVPGEQGGWLEFFI